MSVQFLESKHFLFESSFSLYIRTIIKSLTVINKQTTIFIEGWTCESWWTFVGNVYLEEWAGDMRIIVRLVLGQLVVWTGHLLAHCHIQLQFWTAQLCFQKENKEIRVKELFHRRCIYVHNTLPSAFYSARHILWHLCYGIADSASLSLPIWKILKNILKLFFCN